MLLIIIMFRISSCMYKVMQKKERTIPSATSDPEDYLNFEWFH